MRVHELRELLAGDEVDDNMEIVLSFVINAGAESQDVIVGGIGTFTIDETVIPSVIHLECDQDAIENDDDDEEFFDEEDGSLPESHGVEDANTAALQADGQSVDTADGSTKS